MIDEQIKIAFSDCYDLMQIKKIFYIEDTLSFLNEKKNILFDFLYLENEEKNILVEKIRTIDSDLGGNLDIFYSEFDKIKPNRNEIPNGEIEFLLKKDVSGYLTTIYEEINFNNEEVMRQFNLHGVGLNRKSIPNECIIPADYHSEGKLSLRLYQDFMSKDKISFETEVIKAVARKENFIVVVDDNLKENSRSEEIIECIEQIDSAGLYGAFILLSSQKVEKKEKFNKKIYIKYVNKTTSKDDDIMEAILSSYYSVMIRQMQKSRENSLSTTFNEILKNKGIAVYLASMARDEGVINYDVIENWIDLNERYNRHKINDNGNLKNMICLSNILSLSESSTQHLNLDKSKDIQIYEEYDFSVNDIYKSVAPGDVFLINDNYYILIGQECDLSLRVTKKDILRKNKECILLKAEILDAQYVSKDQHLAGYESVLISNFKKRDGELCTIRIDCSKPKYIDDYILDLCCYNTEGISEISLDSKLDNETKYMISKSMYARFIDINSKFISLKNFTSNFASIEEYKQVVDILQTGNKKIIESTNFDLVDDKVSYPVQRVVRLKKYVKMMTKMYSEYKWRLAYDTIILDATEFIKINLIINDNPCISIDAGVQLTSDRRKNREKIKNTWFIKEDKLKQILINNGATITHINGLDKNDDYFIFEYKQKDYKTNIKYRKIKEREDNSYTLKIDTF